MSDPIVITRSSVKRGWGDLEPKVMWALIAGGVALFALLIIKDQGVLLSPLIEQAAPYIAAILAGYITPSAGQTIISTQDTSTGRVVNTEAHTGPTVTTVTGSIPVQVAPASGSFTGVLNGGAAPVAESVSDQPVPERVDTSALTAVVPSSDRVQSWGQNLPSSSPFATGPTDPNATERLH